MSSSKSALACLVLFFAALWLPLGQQDFLADHWMKVGTFMAPALLFLAFSFRGASGGPLLTDVKVMSVLFVVAYIAHQFEEHWIDLLGREYPLRALLNEILRNAFGPEAHGAMTKEAIFFINTSVVWMIGFLAVWRAPAHVFPALAMAGVIVVNGVAHVGQGLAAGAYNPGLFTGLVLFLPLSILFFRALLTAGITRPMEIAAGVIWAVLAHVILFGGIVLANTLGIIPVSVYYVVLILWAMVPVLVFRPGTV